jgi:hypothetical protein
MARRGAGNNIGQAEGRWNNNNDRPARLFEADRARAEKAVDVEKRTAFGSVGAFASELNFLT